MVGEDIHADVPRGDGPEIEDLCEVDGVKRVAKAIVGGIAAERGGNGKGRVVGRREREGIDALANSLRVGPIREGINRSR